ncbi:MAG: hypothetical protein ACI4JA_11530 [Oscillospiraceae bacterium]
MLFKEFSEQINKLNYLFLTGLKDLDENFLEITLCGGFLSAPTAKELRELDEYSAKLVKEGKAMVLHPDYSRIYRMRFENYISYGVRNESYACADRDEANGQKLICTESSDYYLDNIFKTAFASGTDSFKHYGIFCENQAIDVAAFSEPETDIIVSNFK